MRKSVVLAGSVAVAGLAVAAGPAAQADAGYRQGGPYAVGTRSYVFVDESRSTARNGSYPGASTRTLPTLLGLGPGVDSDHATPKSSSERPGA